jgi:hypothetical protein
VIVGLWFLAIAGGLVWLYARFDRKRYRGKASAGQRPTGEVFRDPASGKTMRVYEDPVTGARDYREE